MLFVWGGVVVMARQRRRRFAETRERGDEQAAAKCFYASETFKELRLTNAKADTTAR